MYLPDHFRVDDVPRMHQLMRERPLATLVSSGTSGLFASHLPCVLKAQGGFGVIECHLARANRQWRELAHGPQALLIFQGPDAYVTPSWYASKAEHGKVVPTWNFATVHAYARAEIVDDPIWLLRHVTELTRQHESGLPAPWSPTDAPESYIAAMLRGIVGLRFAIERLEGKWKMSQNREPGDQAGVAHGLQSRAEADDAETAALIIANLAARET